MKLLRIIAAVCLFTISGVSSAIPYSSTDLWQNVNAGGDYGSTVPVGGTSGTKLISGSSDIRNMFGFSAGVEPTSTIFKDFYYPDGIITLVPDGYVHWVEWNTSSEVNLHRFVLHAANENPYDPAPARSFSQFTKTQRSSALWAMAFT